MICEHHDELCAIKGITPERARAIHDSFAAVASIANVDSWLRHIGLGKANARRVRKTYGDDAARLVRENPYRLADEIHGSGGFHRRQLARDAGDRVLLRRSACMPR